MKTVTTTRYTLDELRDLAEDPDSNVTHDAYERAFSWVLGGQLDYHGHDWLDEDLSEIGLSLNAFDIDRGTISLSKTAGCWWDVAAAILEEHENTAPTYRLVQKYLRLAIAARRKWLLYEREVASSDDDEPDRRDFEDTYVAEELLKEFIYELGEEYLLILRAEIDYRSSEENIHLTADASDYHFDEHGRVSP